MRAKDTLKRKDTFQQQIWDYIRRNPNFRFGDILMIVSASDKTVRRYLYLLGKIGYIERARSKTSTIKECDVMYSITKSFGVTAPIVKHDMSEVFDPNTEETFKIESEVVLTETYTYYSRLLGLGKGLLRGYKLKYPHLKTPYECYEHYLQQRETRNKIQKLYFYLKRKGLLREFSKYLVSKNIYKSVDHFPALRVSCTWVGKVRTMEKYENIITSFEELYGSIDTLEATE